MLQTYRLNRPRGRFSENCFRICKIACLFRKSSIVDCPPGNGYIEGEELDGFLKEFVSSAQKDQQVGGQRGNSTRLVARVGSRLVARDAQ